jgi:simple sugar transport system ATP-binding protein
MKQASVETPAVELRNLKKVFGEVVANADISMRVPRGSIHAVIGENGAGKSTAMKMLYGIYQPDEGEVWLRGEKKVWRSPRDAILCGVGMVHQHFMLAEPYTALENILLGAESARGIWTFLPRVLRPIDREGARAKLEALAYKYGLRVNFDERVENLSVGEQQRIEILKLLYQNAEILILDEPTAVLTPQETGELFQNLKKLAALGKTILIITHKLKEVMSLSDEITVFRAGRVVGSKKTSHTSIEELAQLMVGRKVELAGASHSGAVVASSPGDPVLSLREVSIKTAGRAPLKNLSFGVHAGEILGIAGVEGNGQSELLQLLTHPASYRKFSEGSLEYFGREVLRGTTVSARQIREMGMAMIPEDRHREGLLLNQSVRDNFLLGLQRFSSFSQFGFLKGSAIRQSAARAIHDYDVRPPSQEVSARGLSGGNQQKLIIAREFERKPKFLIAAQPTRGVDVGAIEFIHARIRQARDRGAGVLLVSSELDEILALADRILVMYAGKIAAHFERAQVSEESLGLYMGGAGA